MTLRKTLLLSVLVLLTTLSLRTANRTNRPAVQTVTPASLPYMSAAGSAELRQTLILANVDGSFSTQHRETPRDPHSRWTNPAKSVEAVFPRLFSDPLKIKSGSAEAQCQPLHANPNSHSELVEGALIYRDAFPGCDVKYKSTTYKTEEFIVIKDKTALDQSGNVSWTWDIQSHYEGAQLTPRLTPMHTIELVDDQNIPRLRIDTPFGKDKAGTAVVANEHLCFRLEGSRLTLELNASNLQFPIQIDPSWSSTGTMAQLRGENFTLNKLVDGKVLVAGGNSFSFASTPSSSELFDPNTNVWISMPTLLYPHEGHAAVLLGNGNVLLMGGSTTESGFTAHAQCELFNPATQTYTSAAPMNCRRKNFAAILLSDGKVLVTGGNGHLPGAMAGSSLVLDRVEVYDPALNTWTETAAAPVIHFYHSLLLLADGSVALVGGNTGPGYVDNAYIRNSTTGSWATAGATSHPHYFHAALPIDSNTKILMTGGFLMNQSDNVAELFDSQTQNWSAVQNLTTRRSYHTINQLVNGQIILVGGFNDVAGPVSSTEVFRTGIGFSNSLAMLQNRYSHQTVALDNGKLLVAGGVSGSRSGGSAISTCEILDPTPVASSQQISLPSGTSAGITLQSICLYPDPQYTVTALPLRGTLSGVAPNLTYTTDPSFVGTDEIEFKVSDGFLTSLPNTVSIRINPSPPVFDSGPVALPSLAQIGESIVFSASVSDSTAVSIAWNFGDSTSGSEASVNHAYTAAGQYQVTAVATDAAGTSTTKSLTVVISQKPSARFTTSDVVGFVGVPLVFDASNSSDPENAIALYSWSFGDGTPDGSGQVIGKVFLAEGTYSTTLTVVDAAGQQSQSQRLIEILPADQIGVFNAFVEFKTSFDRTKTVKDSLTLKARLNVGDSQIGNASAVALEIAGQRFEATLNSKLLASVKVAPKQTWKIQFATRKQSAGQVDVQVTIKNADLGLGFNQLGAVPGGDGSASIAVPVRLEIGANAFEIPCDTEFDFNKAGTKAKGEGASD